MRKYGFLTYLSIFGALLAGICFALDVGGVATTLTALFGVNMKATGGVVCAMALAPFPVDPVLTAISNGVRNAKMIADFVLPRIPVGKQAFKYPVYDERETMTIQPTAVGRRSKPNKVEFSMTEVDGSCDGHGLDDEVPQDDIDNAPAGYNPVGVAVEGVTELINLAREKRVADVVFAPATYAAGNKVQLSGNHQ